MAGVLYGEGMKSFDGDAALRWIEKRLEV